MSVPGFLPVRLEDKEVIDRYFREIDSRNCDMCFSTMYLWRDHYCLTWAEYDNMLLVKSEQEDGLPGFYFPIGSGDPTASIDLIEDYSAGRGGQTRIFNISEAQEAWLSRDRPGRYTVSYNRDVADYVYDRKKLASLSGRKYHGKKNHINKFKRTYDHWTYEKISPDNRQECLAMLNEWKKVNSVDSDFEKYQETCVARNALLYLEELSLKGGLIRAGGEIAAFSIGEKINSDTFVVHIEKAFSHVPGAYAIINQQFIEHEAGDCLYVNREDDAGDEGLRQAKISYHPLFMINKGMAIKQ